MDGPFLPGMLVKKRCGLFDDKHIKTQVKLVVTVVHPSVDGYTVLKTIDLGNGRAPKLDWIFDEYWEEA